MQSENSAIRNISPSIKLIILGLLTLCLIVAKSIYLILLIGNFTLLLCILTKQKVNIYVKFIKNIFLLLFIFIIAYIIILKEYEVLKILIVFYKIINIVLLIKVFILNVNFNELNQAIYSLFFLLRKANIDLKKIAFDITLSLYFINYFISSKEYIKQLKSINFTKEKKIKFLIAPRIIYSLNMLNKLQLKLKLNHYKLGYERCNLKSVVLLILFVIFFVVCLFKEVIL